jgi:hypothetical protein
MSAADAVARETQPNRAAAQMFQDMEAPFILGVTAKASKPKGQRFWFGLIWTNHLFDKAS